MFLSHISARFLSVFGLGIENMIFCQESFQLCYYSKFPYNSEFLLIINYIFQRKWHKNKKGTKKNSKPFSKLPNQISSCCNTLWTAKKRILWTFAGMTSLTSNLSKLRNFVTSWKMIRASQNFVEAATRGVLWKMCS